MEISNPQKLFSLILISLIIFSPLANEIAFSAQPAAEYLCEFGISFYRMGRYDDALSEFKKVLLLEPQNKTAREYVNKIFQAENSSLMQEPRSRQKYTPTQPQKFAKREGSALSKNASGQSRESAINNTFDIISLREQPGLEREGNKYTTKQDAKEKKWPKEKPEKAETEGLRVSGEVQARVGITADDFYWKRANWDLNEENFRALSDTALDRRENTFDPRIYDRLALNIDAGGDEGFGLHSNIVVDPWSFTGRSDKVTLTGVGGDSAEIELKYWSNTGYTVNEIVNTLQNGDSFALPEIKVVNGKTRPVTVRTAFNNIFDIPSLKIHREFQPVRELWVEHNKDNTNFRIFPIAYENQALNFDDPLVLSNNHTWWEDSPWIRGWKPGLFNSGATPQQDFTKGFWDNTFSFFTRDSEGRRLTALRGLSFQTDPSAQAVFQTSIASPKTLWQEYSDVDNLIFANRLKTALTDSFDLGLTATSRTGFNVNEKNKLDASNFVLATDLGYEIANGLKTTFEVARSQSDYDITNSRFEAKSTGFAYHFSLLGRFPQESIHNLKNYGEILPNDDEGSFTKFRFFAARLDDSFDQPLTSYVETRDDEFWSRHIHFRKPFKNYYQGEGQMLTWDDVKPFAIGTGMDIGRDTLGFRVESVLWDKSVENLFDVRNVHSSDGKFVENVAREELSWAVNDRLTSKFLGIYHRLPKTTQGVDPFIFDTRSRRFFDNDLIEGGKDPSVATASLGLEYEFFEWMALNGIWEYTNDIAFGYDNFPRGILNSGNRSFIFEEDGNRFRDVRNFLFGQQFFPHPPYPFYNILKAGMRFNPMENLEIYLDYTKNFYEKAGQISDNMNHVGFEVSYSPLPKWAAFFKYTYSRWQDLDKLNNESITKVFGHHNIFAELIYRISEDEDFTFQYGEGARNPYMGGVLDIGFDPYGGSLAAIDTQHIFRIYYRRRF